MFYKMQLLAFNKNELLFSVRDTILLSQFYTIQLYMLRYNNINLTKGQLILTVNVIPNKLVQLAKKQNLTNKEIVNSLTVS